MTEKEYRDAVYAKAAEVKTAEDFTALIREMDEYAHDYGTIVYACAAAAIAGFNVMDRTKSGGITGFQAGCIMWEMVHKFGMFSEGPMRIQDFDKLRYPQYDKDWPIRISPDSAAILQQRAALTAAEPHIHEEVKRRNQEIAAGNFPSFVTVAEEPR